MPDAPIIPITPETLDLGSEWQEAADLGARNLGFSEALTELSPEHWQLVLASVTDRMRLRGASLPRGWRRALARPVDGEVAVVKDISRVFHGHLLNSLVNIELTAKRWVVAPRVFLDPALCANALSDAKATGYAPNVAPRDYIYRGYRLGYSHTCGLFVVCVA